MSELDWEPPSEATAGGDQSEVLLLTLLEPEELAGGDSITLHAPASASSTLISLDTDVKMETRLAMREALLPPRRGGRHSRTAAERGGRCGTCGELPSPEGTSCICGNHVALDLDDGGGGDAVPAAPTQPDPPVADAEASPHGCMFCERTFVRRSDLKSHLNLHLGIKKSVCDVCGRQFSHMSNLYRHMRTHTGERPYVCSVCHKRFSQANALSAHKEVHDPARSASHHPCTSCPKQFRKRPQLARHIKLMHRSPAPPSGRRQAGRRFHCGVCGASFPSRDQLLRHRESHPADSLYCGVCRLSFSTAEELTRHGCLPPATARHQEEEEEEEDAPPPAPAPLTARSISRAQYDMLTDGGRIKAEERAPSLLAAAAGDDDTEVDHLLDQMVTVHSVGTQYDVAEMLSLPAVAADAQLGSPPPSPASPNSDSVSDGAAVDAFNTGDDAAAHAAEEAEEEVGLVTSDVMDAAVERHVEEVIESVSRLGPAPAALPDCPAPASRGGGLACSTCGRHFSRLQNLRQHQAMHDASLQRYRCPHCPRCFAWQQTRDRHVSREHRGEERVSCPRCHRLFLPGSLRGHLQRVHMKLRNFHCSVCNKAFHRKSEVDGHMRTHTQERPFVCSVCGKQFIHLSHMRRHEDRHHASAAHRDVLPEPAASEDGGRVVRTYRSRRARQTSAAPPGDADIVQHSLVTACIPLEEEEEEAVEQPPAAGQYVTLVGPASPEYVLLQLAQPAAAADKVTPVELPAEHAATEYVLCELEEPSTPPVEVKTEEETVME